MQLLLTPPLPAARRRIDRAAGGHLRVVTCVRGAASSAASSAPPAATHTPRRAEARGRGRVVAQARGFLQNLEELREEPAGECPPPPPPTGSSLDPIGGARLHSRSTEIGKCSIPTRPCLRSPTLLVRELHERSPDV